MSMIQTWLEIGNRNYWIGMAVDPPFTEKSFKRCNTFEELYDEITTFGNWCLGTAFYCENICLIQQVDGGDEWLVIRDNVPFDSYTLARMGKKKFLDYIERVKKATVEQLKQATY